MTGPPRHPVLEPRSIAVIGASDGNLGARAMEYQARYGFPGPVWPVNPRRETVNGVPCFRTPRDLPAVPDLAILSVSAAMAFEAVEGCIEAGIRHGVLWAGGFAETGAAGGARQARLAGLCREAGFQLCGPNTLGIINTHLPMAATFATPLLKVGRLIPGNISMVSQSGGTAIGAHAQIQAAGFGFRYMISSGNEAVLTFPDYLRMMAEDPHTRLVAAYLEGVRDGDDFLDALGRLRAAGKPLVIVKAGAGEASARGAAAHTGALTGAFRVWQSVLREHGAFVVHSQRELVDVAIMLSGGDPAALPAGRRVASVTTGWENAATTAALCRRDGLALPAAAGGRANPVILADAGGLGALLDALAADPGIDAVLFDNSDDPDGGTGNAGFAAALGAFHAQSRKPLAVAMELDPAGRGALAAQGVYLFPTPARASEALAAILGEGAGAAAGERPAPLGFDWPAAVPGARDGLVVAEHDCHRILAAAGLEVARGVLVSDAAAAAAAAVDIGFPVAMKGISPAVTHRAAAGLLLLGIADAEAARAGWRHLAERAAAQGLALEGVYVQHMEPGAHEVIVAAFRDPMFGVMVTCGAGGTATEMFDDVVIARAPVDEAGAAAMLARLRLVAAQQGQGPDPASLAAFVAHFSRLAAAVPWRQFELEVNPVKWRSGRTVAVDGLLVIGAA